MSRWVLKLLVTLSLLVFSNSLNVLMYAPTLSYSHVAFHTKIAEALASKGHFVTLLLISVDESVPTPTNTNFTVIRRDVGIAHGTLLKTLWRNPDPFEDSNPLNWKILLKFVRVAGIFVDACNAISQDYDLMKKLKSFNFNVGTVEQYDYCAFGLFEKIGIPAKVWLSATGIYQNQPETLGVNQPKSYVPELFAQFSDEMTLFERAINFVMAKVIALVMHFLTIGPQSKIWQRQGISTRLDELSARSSAVVANVQPWFDFPTPTNNLFFNVGGFTVDKRPPKLDHVWQVIADERRFVLVTFGSIARTSDMPTELRTTFFQVFRRFPHINFIVKYETLNSTRQHFSDNVILTKWIPQLSLMAHHNFASIITHGGWSSILEAVCFGRPLLLMPLFADHARNSKVVESKGVGLIVDKLRVTREELAHKLHRIISEDSFLLRAGHFRGLFDSWKSPTSESSLLDFVIRRAYRKTLSPDKFRNQWRSPVYSNLNSKQYSNPKIACTSGYTSDFHPNFTSLISKQFSSSCSQKFNFILDSRVY